MRRTHPPIGSTRVWSFVFSRLGVSILPAIRIAKMIHACDLRTAVARIARIHRAAVREAR